jgi:uncharacterized protein (TIGR02246 family)
MKPIVLLTGSLMIAVVVATAAAQAPATDRADDRAAILANDTAFIKSFNAADAKGIAATFTEDAEVIDEDNLKIEGRRAIEERFLGYFAAIPGAKLTLETESLKFLSADSALVRGRSKVVLAEGESDSSRYTVIFVKRNGAWLQASSRDEPDETVTSEERLKAVEWLVGEWVSESEDSMATWSCNWTDNKSFLLVSFTVHLAGKPAMTGTQRIGWDPLKRQLRSWVFDSEGGYGEGHWANDGDRWLIKASGVRHDGHPASATQVLTKLNKDMIRWTTVDRAIAGKIAPDIDEFTMVRRPPNPASRAKK